MSLDIFIACASAVLLPAHLPSGVAWQNEQTGSYTTANAAENWIIKVWVLKEPTLPDGRWSPPDTRAIVGVSIQGSAKADVTAQAVVDAISAGCHGRTADGDGRIYVKARRLALTAQH